MTPSELRAYVLARDKRCVWPGCLWRITEINPLQCAHLDHRGMGGAPDRNTPDNAVTLCRIHHDVFDGRQGQGKARAEIAVMLRAVTRR